MAGALALCVGAALPAIAAEEPEILAGPALVQALKSGGLILYFRHASTDFGQNDDAMSGYEDCARQRNLTDRGRDEARRIGAAIKRLDIPVGDVLASPFCRTRETAQLIFGRATASAAVRGGPRGPKTTIAMANCASFCPRRRVPGPIWRSPATATRFMP